MKFIDIPFEQTTAVTDAILAVLALACSLYVLQVGRSDRWKAGVWAGAFGLLTVAAILGTIAHGFQMSAATKDLLWQPLNLALGLTIALFVVGVVYDWWGQAAARRVLLPMLAVGVIFFVVTRIFTGTFLVFVIYQAIAMLFALAVYTWLAAKQRLSGAWLMAAGVLVTIIAAAIQASQAVSFTFIWQFDHNGTYHLIQMIGVILLTLGLRAAFLAKKI